MMPFALRRQHDPDCVLLAERCVQYGSSVSLDTWAKMKKLFGGWKKGFSDPLRVTVTAEGLTVLCAQVKFSSFDEARTINFVLTG